MNAKMRSMIDMQPRYILITALLISAGCAAPSEVVVVNNNVAPVITDLKEISIPNIEGTTVNINDSNTTSEVEMTTVDIEKLIKELEANSTSPASMDACECVPHYQCKKELKSNFFPDYCQDRRFWCCKPDDKIPITDQPIPAPKSLTEQKKCGKRNIGGIGPHLFHTVGNESEYAGFGEFPWTIAVLEKAIVNHTATAIFQCGGALIHPQIVLTVAHCVYKYNDEPSRLKIHAGEWDTYTKHEILAHQEREVEHVVTHKNYHKGTFHNDFGLLILKEPVDLSAENVGIICLPQPNDNFDTSLCLVSGWGNNDFGIKGGYSGTLKRIKLPVVPHNKCESALRTTRLGDSFDLDNSFICAGGEPNKDTCQGDGGSPLVCPMQSDPKKYVQAGIVSWGIGCGNEVPGVYVNVAIGRNWIDEQARKAGFDINEYQNI